MYTDKILNKAELIYSYLNLRNDKIEKSDIIVGFGHFDMKIPQRCAELYKQDLSKKILFTGGRGAGTADLKNPEAIEFEKEIENNALNIPKEDIIIESESTQTGENISFSNTILKNLNSKFCFEHGIKRIIAVASPYRQKRVYLAMKKSYPNIKVFNAPPNTTFDGEIKLFKSKNEDFIKLLLGELERIKVYPEKGFIEYEEVPNEVELAYHDLKKI